MEAAQLDDQLPSASPEVVARDARLACDTSWDVLEKSKGWQRVRLIVQVGQRFHGSHPEERWYQRTPAMNLLGLTRPYIGRK